MSAISSPEPYILWLTGAGVLITLVAWLPLALKRLPLSLPIICMAAGAAISLRRARGPGGRQVAGRCGCTMANRQPDFRRVWR